MLSLDEIERLLLGRGQAQYSGEPVTQLQHALQAATLAQDDGVDDELVTAASLHDLGHLVSDLGETPTLRGLDDLHQHIAAPFLRRLFSARVVGAVQWHVDAKRYLCATRPGAGDAVRVRLWDDQAKSADARTPPLAHFIDRARRCQS